jgi:hypothetical protein
MWHDLSDRKKFYCMFNYRKCFFEIQIMSPNLRFYGTTTVLSKEQLHYCKSNPVKLTLPPLNSTKMWHDPSDRKSSIVCLITENVSLKY